MNKRIILLLITCCSTGAAQADAEIEISPGKWEFRSTSIAPGPMGGRENVSERCVKETKMNPEIMMQDMHEGCELLDATSDNHSMSWTINCASGPGAMNGTGYVESHDGKTLAGTMKISMTIQGQAMNMDMKWDGKRIGDCAE